MHTLSTDQIRQLRNHLIRQRTSDALLEELLDHLVCEVEHYMWIGLPFEAARAKVLDEASDSAVHYLNLTYQTTLEQPGPKATLEDIVFEFRNKYYGAYDLRSSYRHSLRNALLLGIGLFIMLVVWTEAHLQPFSYWSRMGAMWLVGVSCAGTSLWSWFVHNLRQRYLMID